ncbi:MAG: hypothetical protein HQM00_05520 [Magnetococcales bacterium]|nr:hypothetical protein [Magnetococcales bacterium]
METLKSLYDTKESAWSAHNKSRLQWHTAEKKALKAEAERLTAIYKAAKAAGMPWEDKSTTKPTTTSHTYAAQAAIATSKASISGPCPHCETYCDGDCQA